MAFRDSALYVSAISRILRFDDIESRLDKPPQPVVMSDKFPRDAHHGWKFIASGPTASYMFRSARRAMSASPIPIATRSSLARIRTGRASRSTRVGCAKTSVGTVASLGMRFYTGAQFPAAYRNQIFIAEHGSWNRSKKIGYRVTLVRVENNQAVGYEPFATAGCRAKRHGAARPTFSSCRTARSWFPTILPERSTALGTPAKARSPG